MTVQLQVLYSGHANSCHTGASQSKRTFFGKRESISHARHHSNPRSGSKATNDPASSTLSAHHIHRLSDIREASDSSRAENNTLGQSSAFDGMKELPSTPVQQRGRSASTGQATPVPESVSQRASIHGLGSRAASAMSLPFRDVPERRSSVSTFSQQMVPSRASLVDAPKWKLPPEPSTVKKVPHRGRSISPVRHAVNKSARGPDSVRPAPNHTVIRTAPPTDLLDKCTVKNDRIDISIHLPSPLFVGGGTVEGHITFTVDDGVLVTRKKLKSMNMSRLSVDVIGVEEVSDGRRWAFLALGTELFDESHPPPNSVINGRSPKFRSELGWLLKPGTARIPFCINLPLNLGPPPYQSKQASIRYILCPTAHVKIGEKRSVVRQSWNVQMLTVHDPEKALASLPCPLLATDSLTVAQSPDIQTIRVTAGLHRQTWVNGSVAFVDVHVINQSSRAIKKIEIQLEKTTLWYSHAAAGTVEKSASHLRLPKRSDTEVCSTMTLKKSREWVGILPHSSEVRTCPLEIPRGHVTISTGRYFEVRYFINVAVSISLFKSCAVQLPVSLIHVNSLDILPNSLAQVAASIEAKRSRTLPLSQEQYQQYYQGQAFAAPRRQSLDQARAETGTISNDISLLTQELDKSPRRHAARAVPGSSGRESAFPGRLSNASAAHHHHTQHPSCYHCHLLHTDEHSRPGTSHSQTGPKLPRLQVSTSGLGFSESEFELPAESPKKVMLSEHERKMINLQKELKLQRQYSQEQRRMAQNEQSRVAQQQALFQSWRNVAADADLPGPRASLPLQDLGAGAHNVPRKPLSTDKGTGKPPIRSSSKRDLTRAPSVAKSVRRHLGTMHADTGSTRGDQLDGPLLSSSGFPRMPHGRHADRVLL